MNNTIYLLHEYGDPKHYFALMSLIEKKGDHLKFYTFDDTLKYRAPIRWIKFIICNPIRFLSEITFLISLFFRKKSKIVLGIAPYNYRLPILMWLTRRHEVYYHTSYSCWDGSRSAHSKDHESDIVVWKQFLGKFVKHIFTVSKKTKFELVKNGFASENRISVVYHSFTHFVETTDCCPKNCNFISVSRLSEDKGIPELLDIFSKHPEAQITFVGQGTLENMVQEYANQFSNIKYAGFINGAQNIIPLYKQNSFLIMNSQRANGWEELFGMSIIEGMACGCVPITTNHPGPKEIYVDGISGIMCEEREISHGIEKAIAMTNEEYNQYREKALSIGKSFHCDQISCRWDALYL